VNEIIVQLIQLIFFADLITPLKLILHQLLRSFWFDDCIYHDVLLFSPLLLFLHEIVSPLLIDLLIGQQLKILLLLLFLLLLDLLL
jgi:hypothetical protein